MFDFWCQGHQEKREVENWGDQGETDGTAMEIIELLDRYLTSGAFGGLPPVIV